MTTSTLDFPLGRPFIPAAALRRWRRLPPGSRPLVIAGETVRPEQPIAQPPGAEDAPLVAGLGGRVVEVSPSGGILLEGAASVLTGLLGLGNSVAGPLQFLARGESPSVVQIPPGGIIVYPQRLPLTLLQRAVAGGVAGIVAGSASAFELEAFARADLTAVLDGLVPGIERFPLPLMLTEGVGDLPMDPTIIQLLTRRAGQMALLSGRTQPRWNLRPELLLPLPPGSQTAPLPADSALVPGARVRITCGELRGAWGEIQHLLAHARPGANGVQGVLLPSAQLRLENGRLAVVPLAALDRIG